MNNFSLDEQQGLIDAIRLIRTNKIGPMSYCLLKSRYRGCQGAIEVLESCGQKVIDREEAILEIQHHKDSGALILEKDMHQYPEKLKAYSKHFPIISIRGDPELLNRKSIAIVGARQCSLTGIEFAKIVTHDVRNKYLTVSGLAIGIDSIVGENSVSSGHIAVLPGGINVIYPPQSTNLYNTLVKEPNSCVVCCQPYNYDPKKNLFPLRNRLISAIADAVIVIEAKAKSGSLQTAEFAFSYKKPVFAVPGHPLDINYEGNNSLLSRNVAIALYTNTEIEREIDEFYKKNKPQFFAEGEEVPTFIEEIDIKSASENSHLSNSILSLVSLTPLSIEHLHHYLNRPLPMVISTSIFLEIQGKIIINPNMSIIKAINPMVLQNTED